MTVIAGIDEAGFGPVLGPMVVSATAFALEPELAGESLWRLLSSAVSRRPARRASRVAIADSKRLYSTQRDDGLKHLERGVLAMLASAGLTSASLRELLSTACPSAAAAMTRYPWYGGVEMPLPRVCPAAGIALCANALGAAMDRGGLSRPLLMRSEVILEGEFNRLVGATENKSTTLFDVTCRLIDHLWRTCGDADIRLYVDRQGGRMYYLPTLQRLFPQGRHKIIDETETLSAYRISQDGRTLEVQFLVGGEERHLTVALASMLSKYIRELFMELFNTFWCDRVPGIAPTAGYHPDGVRFYREIAMTVRNLGIEPAMLYRVR